MGPDKDADKLRVIDREAEQFERFLRDMDQRFAAQPKQEATAETVFDIFNKIPTEGPILVGPYRQSALEVASRAIDPDFSIEFTVWATTPAESAIRRAARQAQQIQQEFYQMLQLAPEDQRRITATARVWFDSKAKRPVASITVRKK